MALTIASLVKVKQRLRKRAIKHQARVDDYKAREATLSKHGHWSLGYFTGICTEIERAIGEIDEALESVAATTMKPDCYVPNNDCYPLCKGDETGRQNCLYCCLYEDMIEPNDYV